MEKTNVSLFFLNTVYRLRTENVVLCEDGGLSGHSRAEYGVRGKLC